MFEDNFENRIWDEHQWETHLDDIERQQIQLGFITESDTIDQILHWLLILRDNETEFDAIEEIIQYEILMDEPYFLGNDDEKYEDFRDDDLSDSFGEEDFFSDECDDFDTGEEWKKLSEDYTLSDYGSIETLYIYNLSRQIAARILKDAESADLDQITKTYSTFINQVINICAKITAGYSFGFAPELMGGNIAYTKKALQCANNCLSILQNQLKKTSTLSEKRYAFYHSELFELRNSIGIYIQDIRGQFRNNL